MRLIVCAAVLFALTVAIGLSQASRERERVAIAYEQSGDWRSSARIWQELLAEYPTNPTYLAGALRCLKMLQSHEAIIKLFEASSQQARTWEAYMYYGYALSRNAQQEKAKDAWEKALSMIAPPTEAAYRQLAGIQIEGGARDLAVGTLLRGRQALDNRALFAEDLAQLAITAREVPTALDEIFTYLDATQNLARVQGLISTLLALDNTESVVRDRVARYVQSRKRSPNALRLYEWLLRQIGDYAAALDIILQLEEITGNSGRELYSFAERARLEGAYDVALEGYSKILSLGANTDMRTIALYGYVQSLELKTLQSSTRRQSNIEQIINEYEKIVRQYPNHHVAANALLRIAELTRDYSTNPHRALNRFEQLFTQYPITEQAARGRLERLPLLISIYGLDSASTIFDQELPLITRFSSLRDEALFHQAEFAFFRCNYDRALDGYRRVAQNTESFLANDAIERATLIAINRVDSTALCRLSQAELAFYTLDIQRGLQITDSLISDDSDIAEYTLVRAGLFALDRGLYDHASRYLEQLLKRFPQTIYADRAIWGLANIAESKGQRDQALQLYTQLLSQFPTSIYIPNTRIRIRAIRGDS